MDRNQKAAIMALIAIVILIGIAIGIIVYEVQTEDLPAINLPKIQIPHKEKPQETFDPYHTHSIDLPSPSVTPVYLTPPPTSTPRPVKPSSTVTTVTPSPETIYESVFFGNYEQGNGKEPIEWLVLEKCEDSCLLISRYALEELKYHEKNEPVTWETSSVRELLNGEFLQVAFSWEEQSAILISKVDNSLGNQIFQTEGGNNTEDKVFLLSREEVMEFFPTEGERLCRPTTYSRRATLAGYSHWWLRSPGSKPSYAEYINYRGAFLSGNVDREFTAIRPVIRVVSNAVMPAEG